MMLVCMSQNNCSKSTKTVHATFTYSRCKFKKNTDHASLLGRWFARKWHRLSQFGLGGLRETFTMLSMHSSNTMQYQHMLEEEKIKLDWSSGKFEKGSLQCATCGDKNAWGRTHACCQDECKKTLNALQTFPLAARDDISSAPLNPEKVIEARELEPKRSQSGKRSRGKWPKKKGGR